MNWLALLVPLAVLVGFLGMAIGGRVGQAMVIIAAALGGVATLLALAEVGT